MRLMTFKIELKDFSLGVYLLLGGALLLALFLSLMLALSIHKRVNLHLWQSGQYLTLYNKTVSSQATQAQSSTKTAWHGMAAFYLAAEEPNQVRKEALARESISSLRRALLFSRRNSINAPLEYLLGKAYYLAGPSSYDLSTLYLLKSVKDGRKRGEDINEMLAYIDAQRGNYTSSLTLLEKIAQKSPSQTLFFKMARVSFAAGKFILSEQYAHKALNTPGHPSQNALIKAWLAKFYDFLDSQDS